MDFHSLAAAHVASRRQGEPARFDEEEYYRGAADLSRLVRRSRAVLAAAGTLMVLVVLVGSA